MSKWLVHFQTLQLVALADQHPNLVLIRRRLYLSFRATGISPAIVKCSSSLVVIQKYNSLHEAVFSKRQKKYGNDDLSFSP